MNTTTEAVSPMGIDPDSMIFTAGAMAHASRVGFTLEQMRSALADPRWVNKVRNHDSQANHSRPRFRYCGHGVAVIVDDKFVIAVIADNPYMKPIRRTKPSLHDNRKVHAHGC